MFRGLVIDSEIRRRADLRTTSLYPAGWAQLSGHLTHHVVTTTRAWSAVHTYV